METPVTLTPEQEAVVCGLKEFFATRKTKPYGPYDEGDEKERVKNMLRPLHALKRDEAAEHLGVGVTTLKNVLRHVGISRWPGRKERAKARHAEEAAAALGEVPLEQSQATVTTIELTPEQAATVADLKKFFATRKTKPFGPYDDGDDKERVKNMLYPLHALKCDEAAEHLGVGVTTLKKVLRHVGISRWPGREDSSKARRAAESDPDAYGDSYVDAVPVPGDLVFAKHPSLKYWPAEVRRNFAEDAWFQASEDGGDVLIWCHFLGVGFDACVSIMEIIPYMPEVATVFNSPTRQLKHAIALADAIYSSSFEKAGNDSEEKSTKKDEERFKHQDDMPIADFKVLPLKKRI